MIHMGYYYLSMRQVMVDEWATEQAKLLTQHIKEKDNYHNVDIPYLKKKTEHKYPNDNLAWFWHRKL